MEKNTELRGVKIDKEVRKALAKFPELQGNKKTGTQS